MPQPSRSAAWSLAIAGVLTLASLMGWPTAALAESPKPSADRIPSSHSVKGSRNIAEVWLASPTTRYKHFVLGAPLEAGSIVARMRDGTTQDLVLPTDSVFEDRIPRLADLDSDGRDEIILVRSYLDRGAALAIISSVGGQLKIVAETQPTGRPNTWLNPIGVADFDGDGRLDVAYVQMPHVLGRLRVWTLTAGKLVELASLGNTSNHAIGSAELGLAAIADFNGDGVADIAVPSLDRRSLRFITLNGGIRELASVPLEAPALSNFAVVIAAGKPAVSVGLGNGRTQLVPYPRPQ